MLPAVVGREIMKLTMLVLTDERRRYVAEGLRGVANLAAGAMIFGQVVGTASFSRGVAVVGLSVWVGLMGLGFITL